jgi:hypothetical protein
MGLLLAAQVKPLGVKLTMSVCFFCKKGSTVKDGQGSTVKDVQVYTGAAGQ